MAKMVVAGSWWLALDLPRTSRISPTKLRSRIDQEGDDAAPLALSLTSSAPVLVSFAHPFASIALLAASFAQPAASSAPLLALLPPLVVASALFLGESVRPFAMRLLRAAVSSPPSSATLA